VDGGGGDGEWDCVFGGGGEDVSIEQWGEIYSQYERICSLRVIRMDLAGLGRNASVRRSISGEPGHSFV